ncbi:hypothetical protein PRIPAC_93580 [Pristionchus pacificus]|uniref:tRNA N(3)-methylcytidine methyltransferase n=1 Tax=Pristionchus pacificus TaxID=54126 RepID=A0A8R1Z4U6_PRIPA|nr:hypothetical protein PRIPAC_93580 [Pristionchus pacificus]
MAEPCFGSSDAARELTEEEAATVANQVPAPAHKVFRLEKEARKNWDKFYHRNKNNFFKDRNWSHTDLKEACSHVDFEKPLTYLEAGCGVGNMLFPLAEVYPNWKWQAFDFSANAVRLLEERAKEIGLEVSTSELDLSNELSEPLFPVQADLATLIFVVSAIHPDKHDIVARNLYQLIEPGGSLLIRDYGMNDYAMIRFGREAKLGDRFYARQDGTRAFYFTLEELVEPYEKAGFKCVRKEFLHRRTINREKGVDVPRIFVQAVLTKE